MTESNADTRYRYILLNFLHEDIEKIDYLVLAGQSLLSGNTS